MFCFKTAAEKALSKEERLKCLDQMLNEKFPMKFYVSSAVIHIFFAITAIVCSFFNFKLQFYLS